MATMKSRPSYTARCERSGRWWAVSFPEVPGVFTQARRLDQVDDEARDALALFLDVPPGSLEIRLDVVVSPEWAPLVADVQERRANVERSQEEARGAVRRALEVLVEREGLPTRDVGRLLDLSYQRVAALHPRKRKVATK